MVQPEPGVIRPRNPYTTRLRKALSTRKTMYPAPDGAPMNNDKLTAFAKWIGFQLAAQAFRLVAGLPVVVGTLTVALAWMQGLPAPWIVASAFGAIALVSLILNLLWAFSIIFGIDGLVNIVGVQIEGARSRTTGEVGYGIIILFKSEASFPLQYTVDKCTAHIERHLAVPEKALAMPYDIAPYGNNGFMIGVAQMSFVKDSTLHGELDIEFRYGRPNKLKISKRQKYRLWAETNPIGDTRESRLLSEQ